jgi:hypothetical protein
MSSVLQALDPHKDLTTEASHRNNLIAQRLFRGVIIARCLIMRLFLEETRAVFPTRHIHEFRAHWLFLQLHPRRVFEDDLLHQLSSAMGRNMKLNPDDTMPGPLSSIINDISSILGVKYLYCVFDECQCPAVHLSGRFLDSDSEPRASLYICLSSVTGINIVKIVSGTGLSTDDVLNTLHTKIAKLHVRWTILTNTGAFESKRDLDNYIMGYLPPKYFNAKLGRSLRVRVWRWLRGRYDTLSDDY